MAEVTFPRLRQDIRLNSEIEKINIRTVHISDKFNHIVEFHEALQGTGEYLTYRGKSKTVRFRPIPFKTTCRGKNSLDPVYA